MASVLDRNLAVPLYHQLHGVLKAEIEAGRWKVSERLPNETQIAERFGVSKITVRQALQELVELGYIRREQGRGTFVASRKFEEGPRELTSFTEEMQTHQMVAGSRILSQSIEEAQPRIFDALGIPAGSLVFILRRVRLVGGEPLTMQTAHIPADLVPDLVVKEGESLYEILQSKYHLYPARARETYQPTVADRSTATLLGIQPGAPIFTVERVTMLPNERPFEFVQSRLRGDRCSIVLDLAKHGNERHTLFP